MKKLLLLFLFIFLSCGKSIVAMNEGLEIPDSAGSPPVTIPGSEKNTFIPRKFVPVYDHWLDAYAADSDSSDED